MAITHDQLRDLKFTKLKGINDFIRPVGHDIILTASKSHIYLNGQHLINTEFIDFKFLTKYLERVIQAKRTSQHGTKPEV